MSAEHLDEKTKAEVDGFFERAVREGICILPSGDFEGVREKTLELAAILNGLGIYCVWPGPKPWPVELVIGNARVALATGSIQELDAALGDAADWWKEAQK